VAIDESRLVEEVSDFLQDYPAFNVLTRKPEFPPTLIKLAIQMMVDSFNRVNYRTRYTKESFPDFTKDIQLYGTIFHLLNSAAALQTRNHLPYNDAGLSVAQFSKSGEYLALANHFKSMFDKEALALKYEMNLEGGWGGVASEYSFYGGYVES
jgi:hypothetical protein